MLRRIVHTWRNLTRRDRIESDLDAELRAYLDLATEEKIRSGMRPADARRAALAETGLESVKDQVRDVRAGAWLAETWRDMQYGARLLVKNSGFTATAVTMLALGIGGNTAVFSLVNAVLLRSLPYAEPGRIVAVYEKRVRESNLRNAVSLPDFLDWTEQSASFQSMAASVHVDVTWVSPYGAEQLPAAVVSPGFFDVFGIRPVLGAGFAESAPLRPAQRPTAILSHAFWQRRFGGDPAVIGRSITVNSAPFEIVGVLPASFENPSKDADLLIPLMWRSRETLDRASHSLAVAGRLKPGVSLRAAQAEMDTVAARLETAYPEVNRGHGVNLVPLSDVLLGPIRTPLLVLQAAIGFVLLIACANLANLLLARTVARERELSVRLAIGAGRGRLVRQLLCESALLSLAGGLAGIAVAYWMVPVLRSLAPPDLTAPGLREAGVDGAALGVCLLLSILCGLLFGLAPAWRGAGANLATALKEGAVSGGRRGERIRMLLIASQVALSTVLLVGAGLTLRSFAALRAVDPGFRSEGVLTMQLGIPGNRYRDPVQVVHLTTTLMEDVRRLPGVEAVGTTSALPVSGMDGRTGLAIEGVAPPDPNIPRRAHIRYVSPGYFETMGMRIVEGRPFLNTDAASGKPVMIVNETAARQYFPQGKALGHRGHRGGVEGPWAEVVGVVADVRHWGLDVEPRPEQYYCALQQPSWNVVFTLRANGDPRRFLGDVRRLLRQIDPLIPLSRVQTMDETVGRSIAAERSILLLLGAFAGFAALLTAAGIWGTMVYLLSQRRREIGIRLALGATNAAIVRGVVARAMRPTAAGLALGLGVSAALTRVVSASLVRVSLADPVTYAAVFALLAAVAWAANFFPAHRSARIASTTVLRQE